MGKAKPSTEDVLRLLNENLAAKALLQEALDKSAELVAHRENEVREQAKRANNNYDWWQEEKLVVKDLRKRLEGAERNERRVIELTNDRDALQRRLDKCLGWIARAQDKGPYGASDDDPAFPFNNGSR